MTRPQLRIISVTADLPSGSATTSWKVIATRPSQPSQSLHLVPLPVVFPFTPPLLFPFPPLCCSHPYLQKCPSPFWGNLNKRFKKKDRPGSSLVCPHVCNRCANIKRFLAGNSCVGNQQRETESCRFFTLLLLWWPSSAVFFFFLLKRARHWNSPIVLHPQRCCRCLLMVIGTGRKENNKRKAEIAFVTHYLKDLHV